MESPESGIPERRLSGRRAQALRNDVLIRQAARDVFTADPDAPMSSVARRAHVGISALYRRYVSKEELLRQIARDGLQQYLDEAEAAVADEGDAWAAFAAFMARILDAETEAITINLAGTFEPSADLIAMALRANELNEQIVARTMAEGGLRPDIVVDDLTLILEQVSSIRLGDDRRTREFRHRYLALFLDGLRLPASGPLPGPPPTPDETASRWVPRNGDLTIREPRRPRPCDSRPARGRSACDRGSPG